MWKSNFSPKAGLFRRLKNASEWHTAKKVVDAYIVQKQVKEISCTLISLSSSLSTVTKTHILIDENIFSNFWSKQKWINFSIQTPLFPDGTSVSLCIRGLRDFPNFFFFYTWYLFLIRTNAERQPGGHLHHVIMNNRIEESIRCSPFLCDFWGNLQYKLIELFNSNS